MHWHASRVTHLSITPALMWLTAAFGHSLKLTSTQVHDKRANDLNTTATAATKVAKTTG